MRYRLSESFTIARRIRETEGLTTLLRRGFTLFLTRLTSSLFRYETFYLYEHTMRKRNEADFMPSIQNFSFQIVSTNQQADELVRDGFNDFRRRINNVRRGLDGGAIFFCIFVRAELAHIAWVAMTEEAKNACDTVPFHVDFSDNQACTGGAITILKYRGKGLMTYSIYKRFQYLWERGIKTSRNVILTGNIISQRVIARFDPKIYAKARYLKILWWASWKETPLAGI